MVEKQRTALDALLRDDPRESIVRELPGRFGRVGLDMDEPTRSARIVALTIQQKASLQVQAIREVATSLQRQGYEKLSFQDAAKSDDPLVRTYFSVFYNCMFIREAFRHLDAIDEHLFEEWRTLLEITSAERDMLFELAEAAEDELSPLKNVQSYEDLAKELVALGEANGELRTLLKSYARSSLVGIATSLVELLGKQLKENYSLSILLNAHSANSTASSTPTAK